MTNSIASSLGVGSGVDVTQLVTDLANASRQPKVARLDKLNSANQAKISAVAQARSDLEGFASSVTSLVDGGAMRTQPTSSDSTMLEASASAGYDLGNLASTIEISQLARAQTLYSDSVSDSSAAIGQGKMTLTIGSTSYEVTIDSSNDSLTGLRDALNALDTSVTASVQTDSTGSRLVLKGTTGADNSFTLSPASDADAGLASFAYGAGADGMTRGQAAQDAEFTVDGVSFSRSTNTVSDAIDGVQLVLKQVTGDTPVTLTGTRQTAQLKSVLQDFVSVYNTLKADIAKAQGLSGTGQAMSMLDRKLSALLSTALTSHASASSLSDIGIATNRDGTIRLDQTKLDDVLSTYPEAVEEIFNPLRDDSHDEDSDPGLSVTLANLADDMTTTDGVLEALKSRLQDEVDDITKTRAAMETRESAYQARLQKQFSAMESRIALLKATQSYMEQQITAWNNQNN